jgi:hypothetical protein
VVDLFEGLSIPAQSLIASKSGRVSIAASCPTTTPGACNGTLKLTATTKSKKKKGKKAKSVSLGSADFSIAKGAEGTIKVKLSKSGKSALTKARKLSATATAVTTDAAGLERTTHGSIKLNAAKAKKKH